MKSMTKTAGAVIVSALAVIVITLTPAEARHRGHHRSHMAHHRTTEYMARADSSVVCPGGPNWCSQDEGMGSGAIIDPIGTLPMRSARPRGHRHPPEYTTSAAYEGYEGGVGVTYLPHPSGCPGTAFCGCGAAKELGVTDRAAWLAAWWRTHYHGAVQVAIWGYHHVAVIRHKYSDGTALLADYNSGGHKSRLWRRSLAGATIRGGS